jgi:bacillithiol synthase
MESRCLRHTELPHTSRLFEDYLYHFDKVAGFYEYSPHKPSSFREAMDRLDFPEQRRAALVSALREQNGDHPTLGRLAHPGTVVVVTGQQVGLYSGPAYTIYKALTAVKLAARLTERGTPAVPVFWLATEDHDFAEVNHCWVFDSSHRPVRLEARSAGRTEGPVGDVVISSELTGELRQALSGFAFGDDVAALVEQTYTDGRSFGAAFRELLRRLLEKFGLLYLDPMQPAVRELAAPVLRRALETASDLVPMVLERNSALAEAGYHAQVHVEPDSSLLFLLEGSRRLALRRTEDGYIAGTLRLSANELADRAESLSPNALLRPVVQDYLLPVAASVVGPAELAYLAQSQVLYRALLGRMPVVVPRAGFTLLDSRSDRLISRYGLAFGDFYHGEAALRERIASRLVPPGLSRCLWEASAATEKHIERLRAELVGFDPTLAAALDTSRRKIVHQFTKLERKVARESLRRDERASEEAAYVYGLVCPEKHLQERLYSILPFLAKHGLELLDAIYDNVQLDCPDHQVLVV